MAAHAPERFCSWPRAIAWFVAIAAGVGASSAGCKGPDSANVALRRENQALREQMTELRRQRDADAATIAALQRRATGESSPVAILPPEMLDRLFTVSGLQLGRLTGGLAPDRLRRGSAILRVQATPVDSSGQPLKAAGSFVVEAFDLSSEGRLVQRWTFDLAASRQAWHGGAMLYCYLFECPFDSPPASSEITLKVTFTDELTGRRFSQQRPVNLAPEPPVAASPAPSGS